MATAGQGDRSKAAIANLLHRQPGRVCETPGTFSVSLTPAIIPSVRVEPGVLAICAVAEEDAPTKLTFFEIYSLCSLTTLPRTVVPAGIVVDLGPLATLFRPEEPADS